MKKVLFAFLLVFLMIVPSAVGESDLSSMSVEELRNLQNRIAVELSSRLPDGVAAKEITLFPGQKTYLVNEPDYQVYLTGLYRDEDFGKDVYFDIVCENSSNVAQSVWIKDVKLNGWTLSGSILFSTMQPGEKQRDIMQINYYSAMLDQCSKMEELVFKIVTNDSNYNEYKNYGTFIIRFDPSYWGK